MPFYFSLKQYGESMRYFVVTYLGQDLNQDIYTPKEKTIEMGVPEHINQVENYLVYHIKRRNPDFEDLLDYYEL